MGKDDDDDEWTGNPHSLLPLPTHHFRWKAPTRFWEYPLSSVFVFLYGFDARVYIRGQSLFFIGEPSLSLHVVRRAGMKARDDPLWGSENILCDRDVFFCLCLRSGPTPVSLLFGCGERTLRANEQAVLEWCSNRPAGVLNTRNSKHDEASIS